MTTPQERLSSNKWRILNSSWVLTPVITVGLFTSLAFLYVGSRMRSKALLLGGAGYLLFTIFFFSVSSTAPDPPERPIDDVSYGLLFAVWLGGSFHAFRVNRRYLVWKAGRVSGGPWYANQAGQSAPEQARGDAAARLGLTQDHQGFWGATPGGERPMTPPSPAPGWPAADVSGWNGGPTSGGDARWQQHVPESSPPAIGVGSAAHRAIDLNKATVPQLQVVPGVGPVLAQRIVEEREARGGYGSLEELSHVVPPHVLVRLQEHVAPIEPPSAAERRPRGRIIDI